MNLVKISFTLNDKHIETYSKPNKTLCDFLHNEMRMISVKKGCGTGNCGSCTIIMNGKPVTSCMILAPQVNGKTVVTLEGLGTPEKPHPIQEAFVKGNAIQCGFCTPGMIMMSACFLREKPNPTEEEIRNALAGNLCRCTGYIEQIRAIKSASLLLSKET